MHRSLINPDRDPPHAIAAALGHFMAVSPPLLTPAQAIETIAKARRDNVRAVFLQGGPGEPIGLRAAWQDAPELASGLEFVGLMLPGVNGFDYSALAPDASMRLFLATADLAPAIAAGRARVAPVNYSLIPTALQQIAWAACVLHVAPPGPDGACSLGLCADAAPSVLHANALKIGVINHAMPNIADAPRVPLSMFDAIVEVNAPLASFANARAPTPDAITAAVAGMTPDGATVQIGIGRLPSALLPLLRAKSDLACFGGLVARDHLDLCASGALRNEPGALTGGVALGDAAFYESLASEARLRMAPISVTHAAAQLAQRERLFAINAGLEIDLSGQVNAEWAGERWIASIGGLGDFARGALASTQGRSIVMVQALGANGVSRIKPRLDCPTVTLGRSDADVFVSEFGVAHVRDLDSRARAHAIAAIAAPDHRADLLRAWSAL